MVVEKQNEELKQWCSSICEDEGERGEDLDDLAVVPSSGVSQTVTEVCDTNKHHKNHGINCPLNTIKL